MDNVLLDGLLWAAVVGGFAVWAIRKEARRPLPKDPRLPLSHVRPVGPRRRCAGCGRVRVTMDLADGWGPRATVLPYCAGCARVAVGDREETA